MKLVQCLLESLRYAMANSGRRFATRTGRKLMPIELAKILVSMQQSKRCSQMMLMMILGIYHARISHVVKMKSFFVNAKKLEVKIVPAPVLLVYIVGSKVMF